MVVYFPSSLLYGSSLLPMCVSAWWYGSAAALVELVSQHSSSSKESEQELEKELVTP